MMNSVCVVPNGHAMSLATSETFRLSVLSDHDLMMLVFVFGSGLMRRCVGHAVVACSVLTGACRRLIRRRGIPSPRTHTRSVSSGLRAGRLDYDYYYYYYLLL